MRKNLRPWLGGLALAALAAGAAPPPTTIVFCAPGFPGSTAEAQPTMDAFARFVERAARPKGGAVTAVYYETEATGVARMRENGAALAVVTAPFFAKHRVDLSLKPRLKTVGKLGADEEWSLVARKGAITSPASLAGWEVTGIPGYAPGFVRGPLLGGWGTLPDTVRITPTSRVTSALLKAASGQKLAVILDGEQAAALPSHPGAADLEVVARSRPLPLSLLCTVGEAGGTREVESVLQALARLQDRAGGTEILESLRLKRFEPVDGAAIERVLGDPSRSTGSGQ